MKTTYIFFLIATAVFFGCSQPAPYYDKAEAMFNKVWTLYRVDEHKLFSEYYPREYREDLTYFNDGTKNTQEVSFLWPMSGVFSSTILLAEHDKKYLPYLDSMIMAVEMYCDTVRKPAGYQAYPVKFGKVDRYYDDNGLVAIDYVDAYQVTKNPAHLAKAKEVMTFIMSGWRDDWDGAVSWLEGVEDQKPACTNGMAMVTALKLYEATGDQSYLELGAKFYHWIDRYLRDYTLNIVWNSWKTKEGVPDKAAYTYNTGTLIQGAVRLFKATADSTYLQSAQQLAEGSHNYFFKYTEEGAPYIRNIPWFNAVLMRGYQELYEVDGNPKYMDTMIASLDHALAACVDVSGLVYNDWSGKTDEYNKPKWLLDSSCVIEFLIRAGQYKQQ